MKRIFIILVIISIFCLVSCIDNYVPLEKYNSEISELENQLEESSNIIDNNAIEIVELKQEVNTLENDLELSNEEIEKYNNLICNLNELLKNVYYVYEGKNDGSSSWGTGFSIEYLGNYYLVTAGHIVDGEYGKFINLGFKANFSNDWIYPKLLAYDNDYLNKNDYAIFYTDSVDNGFKIDDDNDNGIYLLGSNNININTIENINNNSLIGESGSPIIDYEGEITGISTTDMNSYHTNINVILEAIDNAD